MRQAAYEPRQRPSRFAWSPLAGSPRSPTRSLYSRKRVPAGNPHAWSRQGCQALAHGRQPDQAPSRLALAVKPVRALARGGRCQSNSWRAQARQALAWSLRHGPGSSGPPSRKWRSTLAPKGPQGASPVSRIKAAIYKYPFDKTKVHSHIHPPSKTNVNLTLQTRVLAPSALRAVVLSSEPPAIPCVP